MEQSERKPTSGQAVEDKERETLEHLYGDRGPRPVTSVAQCDQ